MEISEVLKKSAIFSGIDEGDLKTMLSCLGAKTKKYRRGGYVFYQGDSVAHVYIVLNGRVQLTREDVFGNRLIIDTIGESDVFAEAAACAGGNGIGVSAVCLSDCNVMLADYRKLITTCSSACVFHSRLVQNMMLVLARKNIALGAQIEHLSKRTTREKLLSYLSSESQKTGSLSFTIPYNRQELADYLCVERSAMSHELGKMKKEGILDFYKNSFRFMKRE